MSSSAPSASSQRPRPHRVLACILCQQRKVKCDRQFPCANCTKSRAQCVPATLGQPRPRKRRFPERRLLEHLQKCEELLRQNNIPFEPLHRGSAAREKESRNAMADSGDDSDGDHQQQQQHLESIAVGTDGPSTPSTTTMRSEKGYEAKNFWHTMSQGFRDTDEDTESSNDESLKNAVRKAWDQTAQNDDNLFFGSRTSAVDLSTLHPAPIQIFRLWQLYLDNINPLLKVTHTPSLQVRIIEAASNLSGIDPILEALMFSIYCTAILSITAEDCQTLYSSPKEELLTRYQFGCQQALLNGGFLRSSDRDCLTALLLYLISVRPRTVPQSLSCMLGVAVRIAQRMGIHSESALARCTPMEAEMRRRLWWSLVLFDSRISQLSGLKTTPLNPTWDCRVPLNANESDLRAEMKELPAVQPHSSDALFVVVSGQVGEYLRFSNFHLDFTNPALKPVAQQFQDSAIHGDDELVNIEKMVEDQYLRYCDQENPVHFMTLWTTRTQLAKYRLLDHHGRYSSSPEGRTETQRDAATSYAITMLEADIKIMTSPLTKGFRWLNHVHFPFPAYLQLVQDVRKRPNSKYTQQAWEVMSDNYEAWFDLTHEESPFFPTFAKIVFQAWEACEAAAASSGQFGQGEPLTPPRLVSHIRNAMAKSQNGMEQGQNMNVATTTTTQQPDLLMDMDMGIGVDDFPTPTSLSMPMGYGHHSPGGPYGMGTLGGGGFTGMRPDMFSGFVPASPPPGGGQGPAPLDGRMRHHLLLHQHQLDWTALGWPGWTGGGGL